MSRRHYKLPSLNALATFETSARRQSFKKAAEELGVTPGAVSHQIKYLEDELNITLFDKKYHRNILSVDGKSLFYSLQSSFSAISSTLANISRSPNAGEVTISSTTALSGLWLTPRLSQFWQQHPEIPVNQHVTDSPDLPGIAVDLKICYGYIESESTQKHILFHDDLIPVCSRNFAKNHPNPTVAELAQLPLIHVRAKNKNWSNWFAWFNALGHKGNVAHGTHVNNYMIALQAASDDTGVVLGWKHLLKPKLDSGELVVLGKTSIPAPAAIYIISDHESHLSNNIKALRNFLISSC